MSERAGEPWIGDSVGTVVALAVAMAACGPDEVERTPPLDEPPPTAEGPPPTGDRPTPTEEPSGTAPCEAPPPSDDERVVEVYFACRTAPPGSLVPVRRRVGDAAAASRAARIEGAMRALVEGPTAGERDRGFSSFFSDAEGVEVLEARASEDEDTAWVSFTSFEGRLPERSGVKSFLPPGVMAELTWTLFRSFPELEAVRFAFDGSEEAFWAWVGAPPQAFTRGDWERI